MARKRRQVQYVAQFRVVSIVEAPIVANNLEEALTAARKQPHDLMAPRYDGDELVDQEQRLIGVRKDVWLDEK